MPFKAGSIYGEAILNTKKWNAGLKGMIKGVGKTLAVVGALFVAGMTKSVMAANEFQKSMSNVSTIVDESTDSTQELTKSLFKLDPALGKTTELTDALYQSYSSGADTMEEAMQTTVDAAVFGKAALTGTTTAVDVLTTAVNAYGSDVVNTTHASDVFFTGIKEGKLTGEQLAGAIGQSIPLFASVGISLEELTSGMAAMTKQGVQVNTTTAQLNAIVSSFLKPSEAMTKALNDIGVESGSAFLETEGLSGALKFLEETTKGDADELSKLLPNIRALKGAMALTGTGGKEFNNILKEMENASGSAREAFDKQEKTFDTLKNSLDKAQIVVGNIGKSFVDKIAVGATAATESFTQFIMSSEGMDLVAGIVGIVGGLFEALKIAVQPIIDSIGPALQGIFDSIALAGDKLAGNTGKGTGAFKIFAVVSKTVAIVITVVGKAVELAITHISNLVNVITKSAGVVGGFFEALAGQITWDEFGKRTEEAGDAFGTMVTDLVIGTGDLIKTVVDEFGKFGEETDIMANDMKDKYEFTYSTISEITRETWAEILTGQKDFTNKFKKEFGITSRDIIDEFAKSGPAITEDTEETTDKLELTWEDYFDTIQTTASHFTDGIFGIFDQMYTNQTAKLDNETQKQIELLDQQYEQGLLSEEDYNLRKEEIEKDAKNKANIIAEKQFNADKLNKVGNVLMDASSSIAGWWSAAPMLGPIAGPAFATSMTAATGIMSGIQTAQILGQEFVPSMYGGGTTSSGLTRINERGGEIVTLPDNSQVIPNDISKRIADNVGDNQRPIINVSFKGAQIKDNMSLNKIVDTVIRKLGKELKLAT